MNEQFTFYLEKNNILFNGSVLAICYCASNEEMLNFGLTSNNILVFIKDKSLSEIPIKNNINYITYLQTKLINKKIFLRIQCECLLGIFGDSHCDCEKQRGEMINFISKNSGVFIYLPQEAQGWGLNYKLKELELQVSGRTQNGNFVGIKNRDDAQKILLKYFFEGGGNFSKSILKRVYALRRSSHLPFHVLRSTLKNPYFPW